MNVIKMEKWGQSENELGTLSGGENIDGHLSDSPKEPSTHMDEIFFAELIEQYQPTMLRIAQRYMSNLESAKDVVQETWLAVLRGIEKFDGRASFKTWLFTILVNRLSTRSKQERRLIQWESVTLIDDGNLDSATHRFNERNVISANSGSYASLWGTTPEEQILWREIREWVEQAIMTLPLNLRRVIVLRDLEGWTAEEACLLLDLSEANQRVLLHRARSKVRQVLEAHPIDL